jgi:hypothetical protein
MSDQITLNGTPYPVIDCRRVGATLESQRRTQNGDARAAQQGDDTRRLRWAVDFGLLTDSQWATLESLLLAPGTVTVAGEQIGSPSVSCYGILAGTRHGQQPDQVTLSCELQEVG